jgi:hypothetical protein
MDELEIWSCIKNGFEGLYEASNKGRLKSLRHKNEKILKGRVTDRGYYEYGLTKNGKQKFIKAHQLVAMAFLNHTPCGFLSVVDHKDFNPLNNNLDNLKITTQRENSNRKHLKSSSKYTGVAFEKQTKKWKSVICINKKIKTIGRFNTEIEASEAYQKELKKL